MEGKQAGHLFSSDHIYKWKNKKGETCRQIREKEYVSYIGSVSEFKKHVLAGAIRNGYGLYEKVVVLSDGAVWIANMKEELFGDDAIQILDYFHLSENVHSYGRAKRGNTCRVQKRNAGNSGRGSGKRSLRNWIRMRHIRIQ